MAIIFASGLFSDIDGMDEKIVQAIESIEKPKRGEAVIVICNISIQVFDEYYLHMEHGLYVLAYREDGQLRMHGMRVEKNSNFNVALAAIRMALLVTTLSEPKVHQFQF